MQYSQDVFGRIDEVMKKQKRQQKELDSYLCLPKGTYSNWVRGNSSSYMFHLRDISRFLQVSPNYLILGTEEADNNPRIMTREEKTLLDEFERIAPDDKGTVLEIINVFARKSKH